MRLHNLVEGTIARYRLPEMGQPPSGCCKIVSHMVLRDISVSCAGPALTRLSGLMQERCRNHRLPLTGENSCRFIPERFLLKDSKDEEISINGVAKAIRAPANRVSLIVNGNGSSW